MYRIIISLLVFLVGLIVTAGGIWLAAVGGSWFYVLLGLLLLGASVLTWRRNRFGIGLYGVTLLLTLVWSIGEAGFDWWALAPRGALLAVLGVLMLLPWMVRAMRPESGREGARGGYELNSGILALSLVIAGGVALYSAFSNPHDTPGNLGERVTVAADQPDAGVPDGEWWAYGRTNAGQRYSPLAQITPENVGALEVAWTYRTGETRSGVDPEETTYEVTPLVIDDTMYICTPFSTVIALDATTGEEKWRFDPQLKQPPTATTQHMTCRGVSYHRAEAGDLPDNVTLATGDAAPASSPDELVASSAAEATTDAAGVPQNVVTGGAEAGAPNPVVTRKDVPEDVTLPGQCLERLFVPTSDGRLITISAQTGEICPGFGGGNGTINLWANMPNITPGSFYATSPPIVTESLVIVNGAVNDNASVASPSGVIRAYDLYTGELVWNFDSKNPDATMPIANDEAYSHNAPNSWSVASYDPDLDLIYLPMGNESPDQYGGGRGENTERFSSSILALDASSGRVVWDFQTVHHDLWDYDVPAQPNLINLEIGGEAVPALVAPTKQGEVFVLNRETGEPVLPVSEQPAPQTTVEGDHAAPTQPHSALSFMPPVLREADMWGTTLFDQLYCRIRFRQLDYEGPFTPPTERGTLVYPGNFGTFNWGGVAVDPERGILFGMPVYLAFTVTMEKRADEMSRVVTQEGDPIFNENFGAPYAAMIGPFTSPLGLPCQQPPWGYVAAADLTSGDILYRHVNGTVRDLSGRLALPFEMGVPGIGGPIMTAGGVAFLSGTLDDYVRGYDVNSGEELWRARLPAGGQATPSTYEGADGRQYLVVVAGGHGSTGTRPGDSIIAYALP
ncbi:membrane-bound PQQ-dependent dehydrogenase, glucose/quinate/shikimate family [Pontibaca methylaminivorans]|uniref:Quinoprotein glucose dehydrogenase n=1 Tax=Pontibaca methylaminivorans TaxID=515897 RepID=A0A1R3WD20_9RHOB|nr:membrane-bound PQQ-dependent dehydrogenase, glucose/quinate/shikimate family [Pontibaca methylaminivorans]SIT75772.1 quinoprotein glucose dehydrogenase [Pontibaca methylaminivorans]